MKAIVQHQYGSPELLTLEEVEKPSPQDNDILIKVVAASINRSDWESVIGKPLYAQLGAPLRPNGILGSDIAGRVEAVGKNVTKFKPGDEVFGLLANYAGGFAEYVRKSEKTLAIKPAGLSFEQAAALPQAALIALQGIRDKGQVLPGQQVLINGAGGGAGTLAIQLAKLSKAEVTAVDNAEKLDLMRSLGADHVVDYKEQDFTKMRRQYDLILDVIAYRSAFAYNRALKPGGKYFVVGGSLATMLNILLVGPWIRRKANKRLSMLIVQPNSDDLQYAAELCASGQLKLIIDKSYPLSKAPEAVRYLGEGHAKGKLVISMDQKAG